MAATRVLVVEDEPIVSLDVTRRLQRMGYEALPTATTGEHAVERALAERPDIILMDIMLDGDIDGIDAAARIRSVRPIPIIYISSHADDETLQRAKITEPFGYILKPFEDRELQTCIQMALYKHQMEERLLENERWLATTLRSIGDAVLSTDQHGLVRFLNPVAEQLLGVRLEHALGRTLHEVLRVAETSSDCAPERLVQSILQGNRDCRQEYARLHTLDGRRVPIEMTATPIENQRSEGRRHGAVLVLRDRTEALRAEDALRQSVADLRRTLEEAVGALTLTTEKRDPYTAGHQARVARLAGAMAEALGMAEEQVEGLRVAALLHDIGKIYIPAEILSKPTRLTEIEMGLMKTHATVGHEILATVSFPWPVAQMVLQHHERLDGTGYPHGLTDQAILPEARILMVADVVEAMSSHRPYRASLGVDRALEEIRQQQGVRYDGDVVACCLDLFMHDGFAFEA